MRGLFLLVGLLFAAHSFAQQPLPQAGWNLLSVNSQELAGEDGAATNAFDGNPATIWHTQWGGAAHPHDLRISLGGSYQVDGFRMLPRQGGGDNGRISQYQFYVSTDGQNWGSAVASGPFPDNALEQEVVFGPVTASYVRFVSVDAYDNDPWTATAELNVLGDVASGNPAPDGMINSPGGDVTISVGESVNFAGTGTDPENDPSLTYLWNFGPGSGIPNSTAEDPGSRTFNNPGVFTVTFTVTDSAGLPDPIPATRLITVEGIPSGDVIPQAGWNLLSVNSQELAGEDGAATNAFDGNPATIWHTQWGGAAHPHDLRISLGGSYQVDGFRMLPRQGGGDNGRISQYQFYVSTDGQNWGSAVASGPFPDNALEQEVVFGPVTASYVRFVSVDAYDNDPWTAMAELNVLGDVASGNPAPDGMINSPGGDVTISVGESVNFAGTGTDPENDPSLTYLWNFGPGSGIPNSTAEDPGSRTFNNPGVFTVTFTVTDSAGLPDPIPATRLITVEGIPSGDVIPQAGWNLLSVNSQELAGEDGAATNAFDGNPATIWHTQWGGAAHPHDLRISLGGSYQVDGFRMLPRQGGGDNGRISQYQFYVSTDGQNWGSAVASGPFPDNALEQEVVFGPVTASYVRFVSVDAYDNDPWTAMAELNVLGDVASGNPAPDGMINSPGGDVTISVGESVNFAGTGTDPENDPSLTYLWNFGPGSGIPNSTAEDPGSRTFNNPGVFTVTFTVTDSAGLPDPIPATRLVTVQGDPSGPIPQSGWSLLSVTSQELVGEDGAATNAFDGNPGTIWHTQWFGGGPAHPHDIRISLGGSYQVDGFRMLPRQGGSGNGRISQYQFYVSTDGQNWGSAVASGPFPDNALEQEVAFGPVTASYVRFVSLDAYDNDPWTTMAELNVLGDVASGNPAPNGVIDSPSANTTVLLGGSVNFAGTGTDPENDPSLTYLWNFGPGSGIANSALEDPGPRQFNNLGVYTVTFTVTDSSGLSDSTPATRDIDVCAAPSVRLLSPMDLHIQSSADLFVSAIPCLDPTLHEDWRVRFSIAISGGATIGQFDVTSAPFSGTFFSLPLAEYTVFATIIDELGNEVSGPGTQDQAQPVGIGDYYVAMGDSITFGLGDDIISDNTSIDGRNMLGGFTPILNDNLSDESDGYGYPHTVINRGVAGDTSIEGLALLPTHLAEHPESQYIIIQYGTNDAGIPIPSGKGKISGQAGYDGSFKDNVQKMITLAQSQPPGQQKQVYLAKAPYAKGAFSGRNALIRDYNSVVDELRVLNGISVPAPDFYSFFENNQDLYDDDLHPNGQGYWNMADMWSDVLGPQD